MGVQESAYLFANISHESIQGIHIIIFGLKKMNIFFMLDSMQFNWDSKL